VWNESYLKQQICVCLFVLLSFISVSADCSELIGILPVSNQRTETKFDWLEYYIQARIELNLRNNSNWLFHSNDVLHLWQNRSEATQPISAKNTIVVDGEFQLVLRFGYLRLRATRFHQSSKEVKNFEVTFSEDNLDDVLDNLSLLVGKWINPVFKLSQRIADQNYNTKGIKEIFGYRAQLYKSNALPDIKQILIVRDLIGKDSPAGWIGDLAQGMIILSQFFEGKDKTYLLDQSEMLLRNAIKSKNIHARLYALLAETYYFKDALPSWIDKTAKESVKLDPQNDLAYLLIALVHKPESQLEYNPIEQLNMVNPWLRKDLNKEEAQYQKGIFTEDLKKILYEH